MASTEESKAVVLRWDEIWHHGTIEEMEGLFTSDFVDHAPSGEATTGLEYFQALWHLLKAAFPDLTFAYKHIIAEGEYVVTHWSPI